MPWFGRPRDPLATLLVEHTAAEQLGRSGQAQAAAERYVDVVATAVALLGATDTTTLALRHQLAHWTGESGPAEAAVAQFTALLADRERLQGAGHDDTRLARHQLAHWHGRAGRPHEAVRRYREMRADAERDGRVEYAVGLLADVGHWQQQAGEPAEALRSFATMARTAEQLWGAEHVLVGIGRTRYAELAGDQPFGTAARTGPDELLAAASAVAAAGDHRRAIRMFRAAAQRSTEVFGLGSLQALGARLAEVRAGVAGGDTAAALAGIDEVLALLPPGSPLHDGVREVRDQLTRAGVELQVRIDPVLARNLAETAEEALHGNGLLACATGGPAATHLVWTSKNPLPTPESWSSFAHRLTASGQVEVVAACFFRDHQQPTEAEAAVCVRLGLPGVYVYPDGPGRALMEGVDFRGTPWRSAEIVLSAEISAQPDEPVPPHLAPLHPDARSHAGWRTPERARPPARAQPTFGPYRSLERVGEGGFGEVHLCHDRDGVLVAVKTMRSELAERPEIRAGFAHEVAAIRRVSSRFTVPVIAADTDAATPWLAVPFVPAPSLADVVAECGPLPADVARRVGAGIAVALAAIHAAGVVHLDLKPANVLLADDGPRVIDFGIARIERIARERTYFACTYGYASPEQLMAEPQLTPASDVFSLGAVLVRIAAGHTPFGADPLSLLPLIVAGQPDLTGLPADLADIARRCLDRDPARRPTPLEVAEALVPGAGTGWVDPPKLPQPVRSVLARRSTLTAGRYDATRHGHRPGGDVG
jgi:hypothetical protein